MRAPLTALFCLTPRSRRVRAGSCPCGARERRPGPPRHSSKALWTSSTTACRNAPIRRTMLVEGDIIRTGNGRAEIVFGDGTLLHLDNGAQLEVLSPERLRLSEGRVIVRLSAAVKAAYFIDTPGGTVRMNARGEYGVIGLS